MDEITSSRAVDDRPRPDDDTVIDLTATPAAAPVADRSTRRAALIATLVAVPVTALVGALVLARLSPPEPAAAPAPATSTARAQATGPVEMPAPALAARQGVVCRALVSQLPDTVRDLAQRPVTAGPEQNAAYGDPALTVACGGAQPQFPSTDEVWRVNGVCWHPVEVKDGPTALTTVDREVPVTVTVPRAYDGALQWSAPIAEAIVASVPSAKAVPSGCTG